LRRCPGRARYCLVGRICGLALSQASNQQVKATCLRGDAENLRGDRLATHICVDLRKATSACLKPHPNSVSKNFHDGRTPDRCGKPCKCCDAGPCWQAGSLFTSHQRRLAIAANVSATSAQCWLVMSSNSGGMYISSLSKSPMYRCVSCVKSAGAESDDNWVFRGSAAAADFRQRVGCVLPSCHLTHLNGGHGSR
jgi:hypothetical protein